MKDLITLRLFTTLCVLLFSIVFGIQFVRLSNGDVLNHYPFISSDGFDWYVEGIYLVKLIGGASLPDLPVLRPPLFVFVTAADYVAGSQGVFLAIVLGLAIFYTYFFSLKIVDSVCVSAEKNAWYIIPLAIGTTICPLNFFKPFLLADNLSVTLSLASVFCFIKYLVKSKMFGVSTAYLLGLSVIVAVIAGMTQTYALIPYLVLCGMCFLLHIRTNKNQAIKCLVAIMAVLFLFITFTALWRWTLPHGTTPENFSLLKLSTHMFGFYVNTWSYYFLPLVLFFMLFRRYQIVIDPRNIVVASSIAITFLLILLCFFYQWPEARFTYYLWPWLLILFFSIIRMQVNKGTYLISILMFLVIFLVPYNYWSPSWQSVRVRVIQNWLGNFFTALSVDRKLNDCGNNCACDNEFLKKSDRNVNSTVKIYIQIKGL